MVQQIIASATSLQELKDVNARNDSSGDSFRSVYVGSCPVSCIREVLADGSDVYIGDCRIGRCHFDNLIVEGREEERARKIEANDSKGAGDPSIVWSIGSKFLSVSIINVWIGDHKCC